jgi:Uma2 family endonuclease
VEVVMRFHFTGRRYKLKSGEAAMNIQLDRRMGKSEFLTWVQAHEGRYELAGSRVVMMTGGSRGHAVLVRRLAAALEKRLDSNRWTVLTSDFGVDLGPSTVRYPDVVVDVAGGEFKDLTATAPAVIAEIISPSSAKDDLGAKADEYLGLPGLSAYLVLAQDEPKARVWVRGAEGFSAKVVEGLAAMIEITSLGIALPLAEIYAGMPAVQADARKRESRVERFKRTNGTTRRR